MYTKLKKKILGPSRSFKSCYNAYFSLKNKTAHFHVFCLYFKAHVIAGTSLNLFFLKKEFFFK